MVEEVKMATSGLSVWNKSDTGLKRLPGRSACTVQFGFMEFDIQFATIVNTVLWRSLYRSKTVPEVQFDITCFFV